MIQQVPSFCIFQVFHLKTETLETGVTERSFAPSFLSFLESDFAILWYKTLHTEVAWTEENAGKSKFTLFAAWLITLHRVL